MIFPLKITPEEKQNLLELSKANGFNTLSGFVRNAIDKYKENLGTANELKKIKELLSVKINHTMSKEVAREFVINQIRNFFNIDTSVSDETVINKHAESFAIGMSAFEFGILI